jgi:hypothetical protein
LPGAAIGAIASITGPLTYWRAKIRAEGPAIDPTLWPPAASQTVPFTVYIETEYSYDLSTWNPHAGGSAEVSITVSNPSYEDEGDISYRASNFYSQFGTFTLTDGKDYYALFACQVRLDPDLLKRVLFWQVEVYGGFFPTFYVTPDGVVFPNWADYIQGWGTFDTSEIDIVPALSSLDYVPLFDARWSCNGKFKEL